MSAVNSTRAHESVANCWGVILEPMVNTTDFLYMSQGQTDRARVEVWYMSVWNLCPIQIIIKVWAEQGSMAK